MLDRRKFLALSGAAGAAPLAFFGQTGTAEAAAGREYYELRRYEIETPEQKAGFDKFMAEAAIPALGRIGVGPVGVFEPEKETGSVWVLLPHKTMDSVATLVTKLGEDDEFMSRGEAFLQAPSSSPAYKRVVSSLMVAFTHLPRLERPAKSPGRVFQLRIYESPSVVTGQKKIEMFNEGGEIAIFKRVGLAPVFFGETIVGEKMPNLTYMLGFESRDEQKAAWKRFGPDPEWRRISSMPEYANKRILSGITNILVKPAKYSAI